MGVVKQELKDFFHRWKLAGLPQKGAVISLLLLLVALPVGVMLALQPTKLFSRATYPVTPPVTPSPWPQSTDMALVLNGKDTFVEIDNSSLINAQKGFTVEAWFKPLDYTYQGYIVHKGSSDTNGFYLSASSRLVSSEYSLSYRFGVADTTIGCASRNIEKNIQVSMSDRDSINQWHHVAGVLAGDGKMDIFVDGKRSETNFNQFGTGNVCLSDNFIQVGARRLGNADIDGFLNALVDDFRISNFAPYTDNFEPFGVEGSPPANSYQVVYYKFDGGLTSEVGSVYNGVAYGNISYRPVMSSPPPSQSTCTSVSILGLPSDDLSPHYIESGQTVQLTANVSPPGTSVNWKVATYSSLLPDGGTFSYPDPNNTAVVNYTAPMNEHSNVDQGVTVRGDISEYPDEQISCPTVTFAVAPTGPVWTPIGTRSPYPTPIFLTPTPAPAITPTPTPNPLNNNPVITSNTIKTGTVNQQYRTGITAIDRDGDTMTMNATGLPNGLTLGNCTYNELFGWGRMNCSISGVPTTTGSYNVMITVMDFNGGMAQKSFTLTIQKQTSTSTLNVIRRWFGF